MNNYEWKKREERLKQLSISEIVKLINLMGLLKDNKGFNLGGITLGDKTYSFIFNNLANYGDNGYFGGELAIGCHEDGRKIVLKIENDCSDPERQSENRITFAYGLSSNEIIFFDYCDEINNDIFDIAKNLSETDFVRHLIPIYYDENTYMIKKLSWHFLSRQIQIVNEGITYNDGQKHVLLLNETGSEIVKINGQKVTKIGKITTLFRNILEYYDSVVLNVGESLKLQSIITEKFDKALFTEEELRQFNNFLDSIIENKTDNDWNKKSKIILLGRLA